MRTMCVPRLIGGPTAIFLLTRNARSPCVQNKRTLRLTLNAPWENP